MDFQEIWEMYEAELASRNNDDYVVNKAQFDKLIDAYEFFSSIAAESGGSVEDVKLEPKQITGGVTAYFTLFYLHGAKQLDKFAEIIKSMTAISIDAMLDGTVCISFTIPGVFEHK